MRGSSDSEIMSLTVSSTLSVMNLHGALDHRMCSMGRGIITNKLSLLLHGQQDLTDNEGNNLMTFSQGVIACKKAVSH